MNANATPQKLKKGPAMFVRAYNAFIDYVIKTRVIPGGYIQATQTENGLLIDVSPEVKAATDQYVENRNTGGSSTTRITTGGFSGTGVENTNPTGGTPEGTGTIPDPPVGGSGAYRTIRICVDDGEGNGTPMQMQVYGSAPY